MEVPRLRERGFGTALRWRKRGGPTQALLVTSNRSHESKDATVGIFASIISIEASFRSSTGRHWPEDITAVAAG